MNGRVMFDGQDVTTLPATQRSRLGIGLVPEGRRLFPSLTVEENLLVGTATKRSGPWDLAAVYDGLRARHGFALPRERLRVAVDGAFAAWSDVPRTGSEVAFIPPVSGG